jgi:hypothetical protein
VKPHPSQVKSGMLNDPSCCLYLQSYLIFYVSHAPYLTITCFLLTSLPLFIYTTPSSQYFLQTHQHNQQHPKMTRDKYGDHPLLSASALEGQAHIITCDDDFIPSTAGCKQCDFIATLLSKLDHYPDALKNFFDPDIKSCLLVRKWKPGQSSSNTQFMISHKKNRVVVGFDIPNQYLTQQTLTNNTPVWLLHGPRRRPDLVGSRD